MGNMSNYQNYYSSQPNQLPKIISKTSPIKQINASAYDAQYSTVLSEDKQIRSKSNHFKASPLPQKGLFTRLRNSISQKKPVLAAVKNGKLLVARN